MELSEKLQELRKEKGLTQEELAEALFVSRTAISKGNPALNDRVKIQFLHKSLRN